MKMICDVPNEVIENVRMGTWCGSSVVEKMIANGIPLEQIRAEIIKNSIEDYKYHGCGTDELIIETSEVLRVLDKYKVETEAE